MFPCSTERRERERERERERGAGVGSRVWGFEVRVLFQGFGFTRVSGFRRFKVYVQVPIDYGSGVSCNLNLRNLAA